MKQLKKETLKSIYLYLNAKGCKNIVINQFKGVATYFNCEGYRSSCEIKELVEYLIMIDYNNMKSVYYSDLSYYK